MDVNDSRIPPVGSQERTFMQTFTIDSDNNITFHASLKQTEGRAEGIETFSSPKELGKLAAHWPGPRLVEIWNSLPGVVPVKKFTSRNLAVTRIWKAIQHLKPTVGAHRPTVASKKGGAGKKSSSKGRPRARKTSKTAQVIALLQQPTGATLKAIMRATGWQAHSVRGFVSGQLGKKMGLRVKSFQRDGERVYRIQGRGLKSA
jgi:hypothetical protein